MSSIKNSDLPPGCVSIPITFVSGSTSNASTRSQSNNYSSNSSAWRPTSKSYSTSRLQPRPSPVTAYDRLIQNSYANAPLHDRYTSHYYHQPNDRYFSSRVSEGSRFHGSRSNEDLLSSSMDTDQSYHPSSKSRTGQTTGSDFFHPNKNSSYLRRSFDVLNDYSDNYGTSPKHSTHSSNTDINSNQDQSNNYQRTNKTFHERSGSPASQRENLSSRPAPGPFQSETIPTSNSTRTTLPDQEVPSEDIPKNPPVRDPNIVALEKLEKIQQSLNEFSEQVDAFAGSTRTDRTYAVLDELAVKLMMRCDELTDVSADIKEKRKEMICNVQKVLAKLESKVPSTPSIEHSENPMETTTSSPANTEEIPSNDQISTAEEQSTSA